jgi:cytoskeletal protein CcmA (bactofilin family)
MFGFKPKAGQEGVDTMIGPGAEIKGALKVRGTVYIDGRIEGGVLAEGAILMGPNGQVQGDLKAPRISVGGRVTGDCEATERLELLDTAIMKGDLKAPRIVVGEGAYFEGTVHMTQAPSGDTQNTAIEAVPEASTEEPKEKRGRRG